MEAPKKVIGLGLASLDQLLLWQDVHAPVQGNKVVDYDLQGGGMVGTAMVAVARLGGQAEFWGAAGSEWMGDFIVQSLQREGVDTRGVVRVGEGAGPMVLVCVDQPTGERSFLYWRGVPDPPEPIGCLESLREAGCLLVDGTRLASALRAAQEAKRLGVPVVGDIGGIRDAIRPLVACMDYAIVSEWAAKSVGAPDDYRRACELIREAGPAVVVITRGSQGLVAFDGKEFIELPAFTVPVVDTTGAGDTFHGAFCFGLVNGYGLRENLAFASATAALKCRKMGGRAGIPSLAEVRAFLNERRPEA